MIYSFEAPIHVSYMLLKPCFKVTGSAILACTKGFIIHFSAMLGLRKIKVRFSFFLNKSQLSTRIFKLCSLQTHTKLTVSSSFTVLVILHPLTILKDTYNQLVSPRSSKD